MITFFNSTRQTQETRTKSVINSTKSPTDNQPQDINFQTP